MHRLQLSSALECVGVALNSKRASHEVILGVAGSRYASSPYTPPSPLPPSLDALISLRVRLPSAMFRRELGTLGLVLLVMCAIPYISWMKFFLLARCHQTPRGVVYMGVILAGPSMYRQVEVWRVAFPLVRGQGGE